MEIKFKNFYTKTELGRLKLGEKFKFYPEEKDTYTVDDLPYRNNIKCYSDVSSYEFNYKQLVYKIRSAKWKDLIWSGRLFICDNKVYINIFSFFYCFNTNSICNIPKAYKIMVIDNEHNGYTSCLSNGKKGEHIICDDELIIIISDYNPRSSLNNAIKINSKTYSLAKDIMNELL